MPRVQPLRGLVITPTALMHTTRHKQGAACTWAIYNVDGVILMIIHKAVLKTRDGLVVEFEK